MSDSQAHVVAARRDTSTKRVVRATTTDAAGNTSPCSAALTYVEDSAAPARPSLTSTSPASPANNNSPKIIGSAAAGSTVRLYTNATCTGTPTATGSAAQLASPGITVKVAKKSSTTFCATATDAAGNTSGCSTSTLTYVST